MSDVSAFDYIGPTKIDCIEKCDVAAGIRLHEVPRPRHAWTDIMICPNEGCGRAFLLVPTAARDLPTPESESVKLGETLGLARELRGWTLRELEKRSGVSNALISKIERGQVKNPGFVTVVRLAKTLGVKIERLVPTVYISPKDVLRKPTPESDHG